MALTKAERVELAKAIDVILDYIFVPVMKVSSDIFGPGAIIPATEDAIFHTEEKLSKVLTEGWNQQAKNAVDKAAAIIQTFEGEITEPEVNLILDTISKELGENLASLTKEDLTKMLGAAYILGRRLAADDLGIKPRLGLIDAQAQAWLINHNVFWVGSYYDRLLGQVIANQVRDIAIEQGIGRVEAGKRLKVFLGEIFSKSDAYWTGLAATAIERARIFGGVQSFVEAKVETYEILPVGDERTCPVCTAMSKHTFKIEHAVALRDAVMNAKTPEDIKNIHPWLPFEQVKDLDTKGAVSAGLALPPYHFNCRCTYIVSSFSDVTVANEPLPISFVRDEPVPSELPPMSKLSYVGSGSYLGGAGQKFIYEDKGGQKYIFKPAISKTGAKEPFRAYVQEAASDIARHIFDAGNFIEVKAVKNELGELGTLQKLVPDVLGDLKQHSWKNLSSAEIGQIQREHVLDWAIGNFDSHAGNFIVTWEGKVYGIDKEQAFRYMTDPKSWKMSLDYHPNAVYGEQEPLYNTIYRAFANKEIDLDLQAVLPALQRLEAIPDETYKAILRPYAESLYGKGKDAENFLDLAAKRKNETRETYREFFTELLKQRDPAFKGVFKFADEMSAGEMSRAPMPARSLAKEDLKKLPVKTLKEAAKAQKIAYCQHMTKSELVEALSDHDKAKQISAMVKERVRAKAERALPKEKPVPSAAKDIFEDLSLIPNRFLGVPVRKDSMKIEGQVIQARRMIEDGANVYHFTFKVTKDFHEDVEQGVKKLGGKASVFRARHGYVDKEKGVFVASEEGIEIARCLRAKKKNFEVAFVNDNYHRAPWGTVEIKIYEEDGKKAAKIARDVMEKINLVEATADPSELDDKILKMSRLLWQHAPRADVEVGLRWRTIDRLERELKAAGVDLSRVDKLVEKEVFEGYKTFVEEGISERYKELGAEYLFAGVGTNPARVVDILEEPSPGLMCTVQRFTNGLVGTGGSPGEDIETGGADSAFVRLVTKNTRGSVRYERHYKGEGYRLIYDIKEMERTDWYAYNYDNYGNIVRGWMSRPSAEEFIKQVDRNYNVGNEIMFRKGVSNENLIGINCDSESERRALIAEFTRRGINEYNGKPIEEFVWVQERI